MPISRFSNPFRKSLKTSRLYNNELGDIKNAHLYPELIPEPNVGYVEDINIAPLKIDSDFARKLRSLGTWEQVPPLEDIPPSKGLHYYKPQVPLRIAPRQKQMPVYEALGDFNNLIEKQNTLTQIFQRHSKSAQLEAKQKAFNQLRENAQNVYDNPVSPIPHDISNSPLAEDILASSMLPQPEAKSVATHLKNLRIHFHEDCYGNRYNIEPNDLSYEVWEDFYNHPYKIEPGTLNYKPEYEPKKITKNNLLNYSPHNQVVANLPVFKKKIIQ